MFAGFDYGTSNCSIGTIINGESQLIPIAVDGQSFVPSTLYVEDRTMLVSAVHGNITSPELSNPFTKERQRELHQAELTGKRLDIQPHEQYWFMGQPAIERHIESPTDGWYIKSPKSFLGASGLKESQSQFMTDVVSLMMQNVKSRSETHSGCSFDQVVIGRPINFQGLASEDSNRQAINILSQAAHIAGFKSVEFFYEPLAAGIDFETSLDKDQLVLVVDIGGGTTDCSLVKMGPSYRNKVERKDDFLGHAGMRVGGNDLDINVNFLELMQPLGRTGKLKDGLPIPSQFYSNAAKINDINAQKTFYSPSYMQETAQLVKRAQHPDEVCHLKTVQDQRMTYQLALTAEQCKIQLSTSDSIEVDLSYIAKGLGCQLNKEQFESAIDAPLRQLVGLVTETLNQAQVRPDIVYLTGGTAKSPSVHQAVKQVLGGIPIAYGDFFGSVGLGLTKWAKRIYS